MSSASQLALDRANVDSESVKQNIQFLKDLNNESIDLINNKNSELIKKNWIQESQMKALNDKEKVLLTRSRMLQISQDRNSFRTKIIYTLIAVIIAIIILTFIN